MRRESETRKRVRELTGQGLSPREIARVLNVSTQAVYKHLKHLEATPRSEEEVV